MPYIYWNLWAREPTLNCVFKRGEKNEVEVTGNAIRLKKWRKMEGDPKEFDGVWKLWNKIKLLCKICALTNIWNLQPLILSKYCERWKTVKLFIYRMEEIKGKDEGRVMSSSSKIPRNRIINFQRKTHHKNKRETEAIDNKGGFIECKHPKGYQTSVLIGSVKPLPTNFSSASWYQPSDKRIFGNLVCNTFSSTPD